MFDEPRYPDVVFDIIEERERKKKHWEWLGQILAWTDPDPRLVKPKNPP